jgi:signal transduction histidine kinase
VVVTPLKVQKQTVALLGVARKSARPFTESEQNMLKAIAEYTSQALINLRLVRVYEERTRSLQQIAESAQAGEKAKAEILLKVIHELKTLNEAANTSLKQLVDMPPASLPGPARQNASAARDKMAQAVRVIDLVRPLTQSNLSRQAPSTNASEVARQVAARLQRLAQQKGVSLACELPPAPLLVLADPAQLYQILEGLIVNAIHVSLPGEKVYTHLEKSGERQACVTVRDSGPGIEARDLPHIFDHNPAEVENQTNRSSVESLSLPLIKELVSAYGGSIWVESKLGKGSAFHFTLPTPS